MSINPFNDDIARIAAGHRFSFGFAILRGLNRLGKHVYAGTVPAAEVARRRAKNKVAKASRKANR